MKFTQAAILKLVPPKGKADHIEFDESMPGFGVRFRNGSAPAYLFQFKIGSKQRRVSLGKVSKISLADAQSVAKKQQAKIAENIDPVAERRKSAAKMTVTIPGLVDQFCAFLERKKRSASWVKFCRFALMTHMKPLHKYGCTEITRADVSAQLNWLSENSGPTSSDQCRAVLHKFFNWAMAEGHVDSNPVAGTNKNGTESRERVLEPKELKKIWSKLKDDDYGRINKLLMLTGQRLTEIGDLVRSEINLAKKVIELPGHRTKNKLPHDVPLSEPALAILKEALKREREDESDFVFGRGKKGGFSGWSKSKERLDKKVELKTEWTHHDYRRTASTVMNDDLDISDKHVEAVLNHISGTKAGVAGTYNKAKYNPQKRAALDAYGEWIMKVVGEAA